MALVLKDRVKETSTTTGTGTFTLAGAAAGYQSFSAIGNSNSTYYCIANQTGTEWEVGIGTYTSAGTTLSRTTVLSSSNAGSAVNFSAGTKDVFVTYPSERSVNLDSGATEARAPQMNATNGLIVNSMTVSANYTIASGDSAMSVGPITVNSGVSVTVTSGSRWVVL
jgi:hypothetical protein